MTAGSPRLPQGALKRTRVASQSRLAEVRGGLGRVAPAFACGFSRALLAIIDLYSGSPKTRDLRQVRPDHVSGLATMLPLEMLPSCR
jgi:hypothetical protein